MNQTKILIAALVVGIIAGCTQAQKSALTSKRTLLTVDFKPDQPLRYRFVSSRNMAVDWGTSRGSNVSKINRSSESLEMVVLYTPVKVDPYGISTIKASCEAASVKRTAESGHQQNWKEAAESFAGKSWTFTVDARGKIVDGSQFVDVLHQAGQQAFRTDRSHGLIKEPDMLYDAIATQWFLWDSVAHISNPAKGVAIGEKWKSVLSAPATMILFAARNVNYTLEEIRQDPNDPNNRTAVIGSTYSMLWPNPSEWPVPYTEMFQMSGMFGFLREYKVLDIQGHGQELFNIEAGRTEQYTQKYTMRVAAALPMGFNDVTPKITIEQTITMQLIPAAKKN
ncbi:MAG: hypothetical protein ABSB11_02265 [Sedimentisphaerales bacterium]